MIIVDRKFDPKRPWRAATIYHMDDDEIKTSLAYVKRQPSDEATDEAISKLITGFTAGAQAWPELLDIAKRHLTRTERDLTKLQSKPVTTGALILALEDEVSKLRAVITKATS